MEIDKLFNRFFESQVDRLRYVPIEIKTDRLVISRLTEADVNLNYLSWFDSKVARDFICWAPKINQLEELSMYVRTKLRQTDTLFLKLSEKSSGKHIGNIKFEPINFESRIATLGIFIGDEAYRNRGISSEAILSTTGWLSSDFGIRKVLLGVHKKNFPAISAYKKIGFYELPTNDIDCGVGDSITMERTLD